MLLLYAVHMPFYPAGRHDYYYRQKRYWILLLLLLILIDIDRYTTRLLISATRGLEALTSQRAAVGQVL